MKDQEILKAIATKVRQAEDTNATIEQLASIKDFASKIGMPSVTLYPSKDKTGFKAIFRSADQSEFAILPVSKQMTPDGFKNAVVSIIKDENGKVLLGEDKQPIMVVTRNPADGGSALASLHFG